MIEVKCINCNKTFSIHPSRLKYGRGKYCSNECKNEDAFKEQMNKVRCVCGVCDKEFYRHPSHIKSEYQFCSSECSYIARGLGLVERIVTKPYNCYMKPKRICLECGKDYIYHKSTQKYCSRECFEKAHSITMSGENNPSYIDGRSENKRCYRGPHWDIIRKRVYKRDNYTCQRCGMLCGKGEIQAHHITPYKETQDNSLDNLITLCLWCHPKVESGEIKLC